MKASGLQRPHSSPSGGHRLWLLVSGLVPWLLAGLAYAGSHASEAAASLRAPVLTWPIPADAYKWLLLMVLLAVGWLIAEFIWTSNRETETHDLQLDAAFSTLSAVVMTGFAGWFLGKGTLEWWFVVPWLASTVDAVTSSWMGINNAAQKPFLSERGTV